MCAKRISTIGIIGLGSIGNRHFDILRQLRPDLEIALISSRKSVDPSGKVKTYTYEELVDLDLDAAIISTPADSHIQFATLLAKKQVHFLVEKPLSINTKGIKELIEIVESSDLKCLVGYNLRYLPSFEYFRNLCQANLDCVKSVLVTALSNVADWRPGKDFRLSPSADPTLGGGVTFEMSHEIDYLRAIFGELSICESKLTFNRNFLPDVDSRSTFKAKSRVSNIPISVTLDFNSIKIERKCIVEFSWGVIEWDIFRSAVTTRQLSGEETLVNFDQDRNISYKLQLESWIQSIETGSDAVVDLHQGLADLELILQIKELSA